MLLNFIEGASKKLHVYVLCLQRGPPTATVMCNQLASKGAPNSNYNVKFHAFKEAPTATEMCKYLAFRVATNSNCNVQVIYFQRGPKQQL